MATFCVYTRSLVISSYPMALDPIYTLTPGTSPSVDVLINCLPHARDRLTGLLYLGQPETDV